MTKITLQALLLTFLFLLTNTKSINSLIQNQKANAGQFPFFVQFFQLPDGKFSENTTVCGATLIHPQWILSAANCFPITDKEVEELKRDRVMLAIVGTNKFFGNRQSSRVITEFYVHPEFVEEWDSEKGFTMFENNIGVGKLQGAFELSIMVKAIVLPPKISSLESDLSYRCNVGLIVGIRNDGFVLKDVKYVRYASMSLKKRSELSDAVIFASDMVFFSEKAIFREDPFVGNNGGPYLCYFGKQIVQYGIISYTVNDTDKQSIIIAYEAVGLHLNFIMSHIPKVQIYREEERFGLIKTFRSGSSLTVSVWFNLLLLFGFYVLKSIN